MVGSALRLFVVWAAVLAFAAAFLGPASAQVPDFTDSSKVSLQVEEVLRPAQRTELDVVSFLATERSSWVHDFGTPGWPDGWSPFGIDPGLVPLSLDDIPFDDPVTGRPDYGVLPFDKAGSIQRTGMLRGRPEGVQVTLAPYAEPRPITELVYRSTNTGLQRVSVVHAQTRASGSQARIQYLFGYEGAGARGEYEGSKLERKRQTLFRIRRESPGLSLEIGQMFNRHRVGAHSGVQPFAGRTYESIFVRIGATVADASAKRQTSRNDVWLKLESPKSNTLFRTWWTVGTLTHRVPGDTTVARVSRIGARFEQPIDIRGSELRLSVSGYQDSFPERNGWTESVPTRMEFTSAVSGQHRVGAGRLSWSAGATGLDLGIPDPASREGLIVEPTVSADLEWTTGTFRPFIRTRNGIRAPSPSDAFGFGGTVTPHRFAQVGRQAVDEVGVSIRLRWLHLAGSVAAARTRDGVVRLFNATADTLEVAPYRGLRTRTSWTGRLGIRDLKRRGVYFWAEATAAVFQGEQPDVDVRIEEATPSEFGLAAVGVRGVLFQGDLDGDISIRARAWTAYRGLRLHPETGLFALPDPNSRRIEQSAIFDLVGRAKVRSATLTLSLENLMSGTTFTPGNQLVPDYPYPERRLRFSVFWPIFD